MKRFLHSLVLEVTNNCELNCSHCYLRGETKHSLMKEKTLKFIAECVQLGLLKVTVTGGEPLDYIGLIDVLEYFKECNISVCIMSSLNMQDNLVLEKILDYQLCDEIRTSIYGSNEKTHDMITGKIGSFSSTLNNLRKSSNYVKVGASVQLMQSNFNERQEIYSLLENNEIDYTTNILMFDSKSDRKRKRQNKERLSISQMATYISESKIQCVSRTTCNAGVNSIWINSDGNVYPCNFFPYILGNIYRDNAMDIWRKCCQKFPKAVIYKQCDECEKKEYCQMCIGMNYVLDSTYHTVNVLNCCHAEAIRLGSCQ